jgi:hypothetical protein
VIPRSAKSRLLVERVEWGPFDGRPAYTAISIGVHNQTLAGNWIAAGRNRCSLRTNELEQVSNLLKAQSGAVSLKGVDDGHTSD